MNLGDRLLTHWDQIRLHVWGPVGSIAFHAVALTVLLSFTVNPVVEPGPPLPDVFLQPKSISTLDPKAPDPEPVKPAPVPPPVMPPPPPDARFTENYRPGASDVGPLVPHTGDGGDNETGAAVGRGELSQHPSFVQMDPAATSRAKLPGLLGGRTPAGIKGAGEKYGGRWAGPAEDAVWKALRWLKQHQSADGSWAGQPIAFTGFALLTFLAHGELPGNSEEFGETVEKAIRYLLDTQKDDGTWPSIPYQHQIAAYALCEAYAMIKSPEVRYAAEKAIARIIQGQNPAGGWDYALKPSERNDMSVGAWCAQALKAAKLAELSADGLDKAIAHAIDGAARNASLTGGFGYTEPGATGLTGAGIVWMQLLGAANRPEVRRGLLFIESKPYAWDKPAPPWQQIYYSYYDTQAKFHASTNAFNKWNDQMVPTLTTHQVVEPNAIRGPGGMLYAVGHWESQDGHGAVMDTCLCALQLEVYYRYLPTYKQGAVAVPETTMRPGQDPDEVGIKVR